MKILLIDHGSNMLDFAIRCMAEGHEVRTFQSPDKEGNRCRVGNGLIDKVPNWEGSMNWADLIVLGDNAKYINRLEKYRNKGYPIFGPNIATANWELERGTGQKIFSDNGIPVIPSVQFTNYDKAIEFVRKTKGRYVSKPSGDADKALTYVSKTPDDMEFMLDHWKKKGKNKAPFILQEYRAGIEFAVGGYFGKNGFSKYFLENFEHKKLMNDEKGPNTGESFTIMKYVENSKLADMVLKPLEGELFRQGYTGYIDVAVMIDKKGNINPLEFTCYDDQTEILTADGWKEFKNINVGDLVPSLNPNTGIAEYHPVADVICKQHDGDMIHFQSESYGTDLMVTPDHAMYARNANRKEFEFIQAKDIVSKGTMWQVIRSAEFEGKEQKYFTLPEYIEIHKTGRHEGEFEIIHEALEIDMDVWLSFLGYYLSEGSCNKHQITISQHKHSHKKIMRDKLSELPFHIGETKSGFGISSIQLRTWIKENADGICNKKRIPREFMNLSKRQLNILLDALILGDGSIHKRGGQRTYYTTSKGLADDVSELMTKVGHLARIVKDEVAGSIMSVRGGKEYKRNWDTYIVSEKVEKKTSWLDRRNTETIHYKGSVYCLNVPPHHLLYVRRNGNATWCGNCRPGWPLFQIQQVLHPDPCEWMLDMINGKDSFEPNTRIAMGAVVAMPPYPSQAFKIDDLCGFPVWGITEKNRYWIHPAEMMAGKGPVNGKWEDMMVSCGTYTMIVSGTGDTVQDACDKVTKRISDLIFPNSPIHRTDFGVRVIKQLPELQELGFAEEWVP